MSDEKELRPEHTPMLIRNLAPDDKPREKALLNGIESLSATELLAIIFGSGQRGKSVLELSREILLDVDNRLDRLAQLSVSTLSSRYSGVGPAKAISLAAAIELGRRCQRAIESRGSVMAKITSSRDVYNLMRNRLEILSVEEFWVLYLSRANRILAQERISHGGVGATVVDVRLVIKGAIDNLCSGIILVHNHPSGNLSVSQPDRQLTSRIVDAAKLFDISVLDHIIISADGFTSFRDEGCL